MENASEALMMAFAVLVFVLALSISISAFGQARATSEAILQMSDSSFDYTYVSETGVETDKTGETVARTRRTVGAETIIPTLYRAYKENLIIIFQDNTEGSTKLFSNKGIFAQKKADGTGWNNADTTDNIINNTIDLQSLNLGSEQKAIDFLRCLLYGFGEENNSNNLLYNNFNVGGSQLYKNLRASESDCLYNIIVKNKFEEFIGTYYMEDLLETDENNVQEDTYEETNSSNKVSDVNKTKRRVIRYVLSNK